MALRPGALARVSYRLAIVSSVLLWLPAASMVYAHLGHFGFTPVLWVQGLYHEVQPDSLLLAALLGVILAAAPLGLYALFTQRRSPLYGAARLASLVDVRRGGLFKITGRSILLGEFHHKLIAFSGDLHTFLAAPTGTGKGVGFVIPNLLNWTGSTITVDIKRENFKVTSGYRQKILKQRVFIFDPLGERTHCYNPLGYVRDGDFRIDDLQTIATILIPVEGTNPYWDRSAQDLFVGLALLVLEAHTAMGWEPTLPQVNEIVRHPEEPHEHFKQLIQQARDQGVEVSRPTVQYIYGFCNEPEKPRGSILSSLKVKLSIFINPLVARACRRNDFDMSAFRATPTSLYLATAPKDLEKLAPLMRLIFEQFVALNTRPGETPRDRSRFKVPVLLLLDEFLSLGSMESLVHALSYMRGWGITAATVIQSKSQLFAKYGADQAGAFLDNHRASVMFRPPLGHTDEAQNIAQAIGHKTVNQKSRSRSFWGRHLTTNTSLAKKPVMHADEIAHMPDHKLLAFVDGIRPVYGQKIRYYDHPLFKKRILPPATLDLNAEPPPPERLAEDLVAAMLPES